MSRRNKLRVDRMLQRRWERREEERIRRAEFRPSRADINRATEQLEELSRAVEAPFVSDPPRPVTPPVRSLLMFRPESDYDARPTPEMINEMRRVAHEIDRELLGHVDWRSGGTIRGFDPAAPDGDQQVVAVVADGAVTHMHSFVVDDPLTEMRMAPTNIIPSAPHSLMEALAASLNNMWGNGGPLEIQEASATFRVRLPAPVERPPLSLGSFAIMHEGRQYNCRLIRREENPFTMESTVDIAVFSDNVREPMLYVPERAPETIPVVNIHVQGLRREELDIMSLDDGLNRSARAFRLTREMLERGMQQRFPISRPSPPLPPPIGCSHSSPAKAPILIMEDAQSAADLSLKPAKPRLLACED